MAAPVATTSQAQHSVVGVQAALRAAFAAADGTTAMRAALAAIGRHFDAVYVAIQAEWDGETHAADWSWEGFAAIDGLRESLGTTIVQVLSAGRARVVPVAGPESPAILAVPVTDGERGVHGAACAVVGACDADTARGLLAMFEGLVGYLTLLLHQPRGQAPLAWPEAVEERGGDPLFLAYAMAAELRNRHRFEQVAIGFVRRGRVRVAAVCGVDEVRASNPGVKRIAAAMEACLDRAEPILHAPGAGARCPLHAQWAAAAGGGAIGSVPIRRDHEIIAVVSVKTAADALTAADLDTVARDLGPLAWLLPVSRLASRGLWAHAGQKLAARLRSLLGASWRGRGMALAALVLVAWIAFGSLPYSFTVPCAVVSSAPRTIASPREGLLREVLVQPGDRVRQGQLLARLDTEDARLEAATFRADIRRLEAQADRARAAGRPGEANVLLAERDAAAARLARVELRLRRSEIRAPLAGQILSGDLQRVVGAKLALGDPMFELAGDARVQVELRIPERLVWDARECEVAEFAPTARPTARIVLDGVDIHPSSAARDGANVFLGRSTSFAPPPHLTPGMEGVVHVSVGDRPVWWVFTHRLTDWMRLRFWF